MSTERKEYPMPNFVEARADFIEVVASEEQPSADINEDFEADDDSVIDLDTKEPTFEYHGIETAHTFEKMEQANQLIGGSNIATKKQAATHYISLEDEDDEDTRELKNYKGFNKDHKVFAFSLPLGTTNNDKANVSPITQFKTMKTKPGTINEIKRKMKRSDSINSLEELIVYQGVSGASGSRTEAVRKVFGMDDLKHTLKQATLDGTETTSDGYLCTRLDSVWNELEGDVVIMGGYRGSKLVYTKTGQKIWVPLKAGFNFTNADLYINPGPDGEKETQKKIHSSGMLTHVGPVDISKKLINKIASNPKVRIRDFGYDWRLSLAISAEKLRKFLQGIYEKQKEKKGIYVIAHSMGGLVAHKVLQEYTHLIRGLIYVGSPSQCPNIIGPFRFGDEIIYNKSLLSKENNFFMRSSFHFLPIDGRCFIDKNTMERYDLDFFDPKVWKKLGLSPLVSDKRKAIIDKREAERKAGKKTANTPGSGAFKTFNKTTKTFVNSIPLVKKVTDTKIAYREVEMTSDDEFKTSYNDCVSYLERTLKSTREYLESLEYRPNKHYPPLAIVYGNKVPTVRGCKVNGIEGIRDGQYDDFYYGPGDGVVHYKWLLPERRGFPVVAKIASDTGHVSLMTDLNAIAKAFISIIETEKETERRRGAKFMSGELND